METKYIRLILVLICFFVIGKVTASSDYLTFNHGSGLYVIQHTESAKIASVQFYFRIGTAYESDSTIGSSELLSALIYKKLVDFAPGLNINKTVEPEMIGFNFTVEQEKVAFVLTLLNDVVLNFQFTENDISNLQQSNTDRELNPFANTVLKKLWGKDFSKVSRSSYSMSTANISKLNAFYKLYFTPTNATLCLNTGFEKVAIDALLDKTFTPQGIVQFNPERITHVLEFKPIVNNTHFIFKNTQERERCGIVFQNPGSRYDRKGSYCAFLLNQILENETKSEQVNATYKSNNYFGTFTISTDVQAHKYKSTLAKLMNIVSRIQQLDFISPEKLSKAKDLVINQYRNLAISGPNFFMKEMAYYRFTNDENYILSFADSLANISEQDMKWYINDYFINRAGVMYTMTNSDPENITDTSQRVYNLSGDFSGSTCVYELNKTDLFGDSNWANVFRVINWLQINSDAHVQINGFADEGEYNKVKDANLQSFIDSIPTFKKAMPDFIKTGYMRPESMRSLKLMKVFYENGIDLNRITGTSMLYTSATKEKAAENRKCTFVVEKIKPTISLREYHHSSKK